MRTIRTFDLDFSDLPATSERRGFTIYGDKGAKFKLEIKDNTTGYYYNFVTNIFQVSPSSLQEEIVSNPYAGTITFPAVTDSDDQYDIFLHAVPSSTPEESTQHDTYNEVRFGDGSLDINGSTGSNSLIVQKVIYQYAALTLTLQGYSPNSTVAGTLGTDTISINRGKPQAKTAFSFTATAGATAAYRVLKQPVANDILSFVSPVVGSAPIDLPGENIYPTVTATGNTNAVMSSTVTVTMADTIEELGLKIGDKVIQATGPFFANIVTVVAISGGGLSANQFTASEAISVGSGVRLNFHNRMNFSWPITKANLIKEGMIVVPATNVTADTAVGTYEDTVTLFEGTTEAKTIIKNARPAVSTVGKTPTIVKGLITAQDGDVVFNKQQALALAGDTLNIGGYGENEILRVYGWEVRFTDLAIALTAPTTTTREASAGGSSADIDVNSKEGVINNVSRVSGIGINPALQNPLITAGGGATGTGDWTMDAVQTLENGVTLTVENTGRIATITGNIQIVKAGTASQTLRFDIEKLLSTSA
ncbi:hypothetical protein N9C94_00610 [Candidatus Pelagibacter sp.]|nr:hypothetical protein [Candidatus Pelagibacter sp.]